jgi:hypothetical protein
VSLATGSGLERFIFCRASSVLPRVWTEGTADTSRGTEAHDHLERVSNGSDPDESLDQVDPEHRAAVEALPLHELSEELSLSAEVTLVYNPRTDTARVLGQSLERDYSGVGEDEYPMTIDVAGVNVDAGHGIIRDYKTGWGRISPTRRNWQMVGNALALARAYDLDEVDAALVYLRDGAPIRRDFYKFEAADFALAAADLRTAHERALRDRETYAGSGHVEPTEGSWCKYCPSVWTCPAKIGLIRSTIQPEELEARIRGPLTDEEAVKLWHALKRAKPLLKEAETKVMAIAAMRPLLLETTPEGVEVWLGNTPTKGNEKLDPATLITVAAETLYEDDAARAAALAELQTELADFEVTKKRLGVAIKKRVPKGKGAEFERVILDEVRRRGGASRSEGEAVKVYTRKPDEQAA